MAEPKDDRKSGSKGDTTAYSASKAPETRREADERESARDPRLIPGGRRGSGAAIGISAMSRDQVPSGALRPEQEDFGQSPDDSEA
jgi:hypothetical protein